MAGGLQDLVAKLRLDTTGFSKGLRNVQTTIRNIGVGLTAASTGIALAIKGQLDAADDLSKMSQKFGISIEDLSRLGYAADLSGVSMDSMAASLKKLSRNMSDAASGQKAQVELFKRLGISVTDSEGRMRSTEAVMKDIADVMAKLPDGAEKTALALDLFGKSGAEMIPMLNGGSSSLAELTAEAQSMGIVITAETGRSAEAFNDNISRIQTAVSGLVVQLSASLAPTLASISASVVEITKSFQNLSPQTQELGAKIAVIGMVIGPVMLGVAWAISTIGTAVATISAVATSLWSIVTAAAAAGAAIVAAVGWPVTLTVAAIAAAVTGIVVYWDEIKAGATAAGAYIKAEVMTWPDGFRAAWQYIKAEIATWPQAFIDTGRYIVEGLKQGIQEQWDAMIEWFRGKVQALKDLVPDMFTVKSPSRYMMDVGGHITDGLRIGLENGTPAAAAAMTGLGQEVKAAAQGIGDLWGDAGDSAKSAFRSMALEGTSAADALRNAFGNFLMSKGGQLFDLGFDALWSGLGGLLGFANGGIFVGGRPMAFANGGVVTGPTVFPMARGIGLMGEAGPEAIMPLTRGTDGKLGVRAAGRAGDGGSALQVHVTASFDESGNLYVKDVASRTMAQGIAAYDANLPARVGQVNRSPRKR
ncbi:phage tail tape measure protein [Rhodobacter capsulatus]|uniref:phage tail tape measure protein n=1 Tax=Rhodobacter capsulatus TaxID=1061 RepID=UPI004024E9B0